MSEYENTESLKLKLDDLASDILFALNMTVPDITSYNNLTNEFESTFSKLLAEGQKINYFWQFCSFSTYRMTYSDRLQDFLTTNIDADESDFIDLEIDKCKKKVLSITPHYSETYNYIFGVFEEKLSLFFLPSELIRSIEYSQNKKQRLLREKKELLKSNDNHLTDSPTEKSESLEFLKDKGINHNYQSNPYPRIFKNDQAWNLFCSFQGKIKNDLADYSFIFHKMTFDSLLHDIKPKEYKDWLNNTFGIDLGEQWKQYHNCKTSDKETLYGLIKLNVFQ